MAADWIIQGLAHTGLVGVVPFTATPTTPRTAVSVANGGNTAEHIQALAQETGAGIVVSGSYYLQGDSLYLQGRITDAIAGRLLLALEPVSTSSATPLEAVEALRQRVMAGLAPHVDPRIREHARNVSRTPSYDAYGEYAEGMDLYLNSGGGGELRKALEHFSRVAAYDPAFTLPLVRSASIHVLTRNYAAVDAIARLVEPRMHGLAEFDRQVMTAAAPWARGDYATSYRAAVRGAELPPNSLLHHQVARELLILNRPREAVRVFAQLDPHRGELRGSPFYWIKLTEAHHLLGERDQALALLRAAYAQGYKWWLPLHSEPDFESLRDHPAFRELLRPKG